MPAPRLEVKEKLPVIYTTWTESESGWGCRPDGISIHLTKEDLNAFVKAYNATLPAAIPHEYTRCDVNPQIVEVDLSLYDHLKQMQKDGKVGVRAWGNEEKMILKGLNPFLNEDYDIEIMNSEFEGLKREVALKRASALEAAGVEVRVVGEKSNDVIHETKR